MGDTLGKTSAECILSEMSISWNPVEHRVFPHVTRSLKGVILRSHNYVKELIENTTTLTGLKIKAQIIQKVYKSLFKN